MIPFQKEPEQEVYLEDMSPAQLREYLQQLQARIALLDGREPKNMNDPTYESWADEHEALEDAIDEVREMLDGL